MNLVARDAGWYARRYGTGAQDQRNAGQRDRDRILYSSAFKRLGGVTQVVSATEGTIFHNRLTHSLKVAQLGRRLAEHLLTFADQRETAEAWGGLDPEVVDAAGLAHDLGHPPFGHIAEKALDSLVTRADRSPLHRDDSEKVESAVGDPDGFEGNAQSFRILTKLAAHHPRNYVGLNLARATLDSVLKYPWVRELGAGPGGKTYRKYGAYATETEDLDFAREYHDNSTPSLEAAIMDFADGLAYSVHDLEDFIRAGLVPLARLVTAREWQRFIDDWRRDTRDPMVREALEDEDVVDVLSDLAVSLDLGEEYSGTRLQRARLRSRTSSLIREFLPEVRIAQPGAEKPLVVDRLHEIQMKFLQRLIWYYVIENPRLATQQAGQTRVIEMLFEAFFAASEPMKNGQPRNRHILPPSVEKDLDDALKLTGDDQVRARLRVAADAVCSFTDTEAIAMSHRLRGTFPGAVTDLVSR